MSKAIDYLVGNYRFLLYDTFFQCLLRDHIVEQYRWRLQAMNPDCYENGSCHECGCTVPSLQMASKSCGGDCYPSFMNAVDWIAYDKKKTSWLL